MSFDDGKNDAFGGSAGDSYSAPDVSEQSLDSGGNYVSPAGSLDDGGLEPLGGSEGA